MKEYRYPSPEIAERIQQVLWDNNLGDTEVARRIDVERKTVMAYRHAVRNPSIKFVRWLCATCHVDANWLLDLTQTDVKKTMQNIHDCVAEEMYEKGKADEREHILEILHGIDRQIENLVICVLASECNDELKEQK